MKSLVLMLAVVLFIGLSNVNAKKLPAVAQKVPVEFKQQILNQVNYPLFAQDNLIEGDVWLKLCINPNNNVKVVDLSSANKELADQVKKELGDFYEKDAESGNTEVYYLKLKFELFD